MQGGHHALEVARTGDQLPEDGVFRRLVVDLLQLRLEVIAKRESESRPDMGIIEVDNSLLDQDGKLVYQTIGVVLVRRRPA